MKMNLKSVLFLLSLSSAALAVPTNARLDQIDSIAKHADAGHLFDLILIDYDDTFPGPAVTRKSGNIYVITYNRKILATLSESAQLFISYHELGHIRLGHSDMDPKLKDRATVEFEADSFAAFLYKRLHAVDKDLLSFIEFISTQRQTTPPGDERAGLLLQILSKP